MWDALQAADWLAVKLIALSFIVLTSAYVLGFGFLKILAHMQHRVGPMEAGRYHGVAQLMADALKFMQKEDIVPAKADRWVFLLAPGLVLGATILVTMTIPFGPAWDFVNLDVQVFVALAVSSLGTVGVLMAGWSSANKYSLMGGFRAVGQLLAYELPLVLSVVGVVIMAGSMNLHDIVMAQSGFGLFGTGITIPYFVPQAVAFGMFLIAAQAEMSQAPFDMPFAESELVAGYATEYSGFRYLFFFLSEFASNFAMAALGSVLFLGGYSYVLPGVALADFNLPTFWENFIGAGILLGKIGLLYFLFMWARSTYPRLREDQLQKFAWKYLIPVGLVNIGVTGILKVVA